MQMTTRSVGERLLSTWGTLSPLPGGKWIFSRILGYKIPYTGSIGAYIKHLEPGHSRIILKDRRRVRNHLRSVHAIALANVAELSTGLAVLSGMPTGYNGILTGLNVEYTKKARGTLCIECRCEVPEFTERTEIQVKTQITDGLGDIVTTATARWLVGPI
jgi:acyl-coenzyme A thioesterase PaaI-like protein